MNYPDREFYKLLQHFESVLDTYTFEELLEQADLTEEEALAYLYLDGHLALPE